MARTRARFQVPLHACARPRFQCLRPRSQKRTSNTAALGRATPGDTVPDAELTYFNDVGQLQEVSIRDLCAGKKVRKAKARQSSSALVLGLPKEPTRFINSMEHLPGYMRHRQDFASKGVDEVACVSVNDAFVMDAWRASLGAQSILMLADGNAQFTQAMGAELDLGSKNVGMRSRRYSMLVEDGKIKILNMEDGGAYTVSGAAELLKMME